MTHDETLTPVLAAVGLSKRFGEQAALDRVNIAVPRGRIVGLIGRNGSGKTTLLRCLQGVALPTEGRASVFGTESANIDDAMLARLGVVHQECRFLPWMTARAHLDFVRSFYERWDRHREQRLVDRFEIDPWQRIGDMSPGTVQKLAIATAICHHPEILLLDEPAAALDPPSREALLSMLIELVREDEPAIVISSHILDDIERTVDWIICLEHGRVVRDESLDALQERYAEWRVLSPKETLPTRFEEPWIRLSRVEGRQAILTVEGGADRRAGFEARYGVSVEERPVRLERMFNLWISQEKIR